MNDCSCLSSQLEALRQFNLTIRQQLELAEAKIPPLNEQIDQLARTEIVREVALIGNIVYSRAYTEPSASGGGSLIQAAILIPGGIGLVEWDIDEYTSLGEATENSFLEARKRFTAFGDLELALKALVLPQVEHLLDRVLRMAFPKDPAARSTTTGWTRGNP